MRIMGVDLQAGEMIYAVVVRGDGETEVRPGGRIALENTRSAGDLHAFQTTLTTVLNDVRPDHIAVKWKPEAGKFGAGPAALKVEALLLANSPCPVSFVTSRRAKKVPPVENALPKYAQGAIHAAAAADVG